MTSIAYRTDQCCFSAGESPAWTPVAAKPVAKGVAYLRPGRRVALFCFRAWTGAW
jgi:hypothetical protein